MKVFITGGTSGIGAELAKRYLGQGCDVAVCGRSAEKFKAINAFNEFENKITFYELDVCDRRKVRKIVESFAGEDGLDLMIANAGVSMNTKSKVPDFDDFRNVLDVNIYGVVNCFEAALEVMIPKKKGHIVAIASVAGYVGLPGTGPYSAAKSAVIKLCESFAIDLRDFGIAVTCICPGFIRTPLTDRNPHPMPFLMSADKASRLIVSAITEKKAHYAFPWQMRSIITLLAIIPRSFYRKLMTSKLFNYSKES